MVDPTSGPYADFHLQCGILDKVSEFYNEFGDSYDRTNRTGFRRQSGNGASSARNKRCEIGPGLLRAADIHRHGRRVEQLRELHLDGRGAGSEEI